MDVEYRLDNNGTVTQAIQVLSVTWPIRHILVFNGTAVILTINDSQNLLLDTVQPGELLQRNIADNNTLVFSFTSTNAPGIVRVELSNTYGIEDIGYAPSQAVVTFDGQADEFNIPVDGAVHIVVRSNQIVPAGSYNLYAFFWSTTLSGGVSGLLTIEPDIGTGGFTSGLITFSGTAAQLISPAAAFTATQSTQMLFKASLNLGTGPSSGHVVFGAFYH